MAGGRIAGITIEFNGDTTKLKSALKDVDSQVRQSQTQLRDVNKLLKLDPGNTQLLQQKYDSLNRSIEGTKSRLSTLKEAERQMADAGLQGTDQWDALQREIAETEQKLKSLNQEMDRFGSVSAQKVAAAGEKVQKVGQDLESAGRAIMPASVAMIGFGTVAASKYADVDRTMTLTNQTMGNTTEQAEMLDRAMADAAANSTFGMSDAANATLNFARAGLTAEQAAAALAPAMNLAAGEGGSLDTVSAGLVATINGFGDSFGNAGHYADVFAAACNNSALDVDSLSGAMSVAAPIFSAAGYSVNDAALYMGIMANNGIEADKAANSLKTGIARLVSPAKEGAEMMEQLGISVTNADGSMKSSIEIQRELHDAFASLSESEQIVAASAIFGKNQMAPWLALINTAPSDVNELSDSLENCAGTTDQMAEAMMGGFGGSIEKLKSSLDVLMTTLGKTVAEFLTPVIEGIQKFVDWLNSLDAGTRKVIVTIGAVVAAAGPVLITIGKMAQGVGALMKLAPNIVTAFGKIKGLLTTLGSGLKALWGVLAANPIILVIAAIAALVAGFIYLWNNSEEFRNFWINLWEKIKTAAANAVNWIKTAFNNFVNFWVTLWNNVKTTVSNAFNGIKTFFSNVISFIKENWQGLLLFLVSPVAGAFKLIYDNCDGFREFIDNFIANLVDLITTAWENITAGVEAAWTIILTTIENVWTSIVTAVQTALTTVSTAITTVWEAIKTTVSTVLSAIGTAVSTAWNNIKNTVTTLMNAIKTGVTTAWENIKSTVSNVISSIGTAISNGFNAAKNTVSNVLNAIKNTMSNIWDGAVSIVKGAVDKLKSLVNFQWSLPKIKLPHFSISGSFSLNPPSIPRISVEWYKKAMQDGLILNKPTVLPAADGTLRGYGDAGPEAVVGVSSLRSMINDAVAAAGAGGSITIPVYIGQHRIETIVVDAIQRNNYRSGGR